MIGPEHAPTGALYVNSRAHRSERSLSSVLGCVVEDDLGAPGPGGEVFFEPVASQEPVQNVVALKQQISRLLRQESPSVPAPVAIPCVPEPAGWATRYPVPLRREAIRRLVENQAPGHLHDVEQEAATIGAAIGQATMIAKTARGLECSVRRVGLIASCLRGAETQGVAHSSPRLSRWASSAARAEARARV